MNGKPSDSPSSALPGIDAVWLAILFVFSSAWCLSAAPHLSATFDEPFYIERGLQGWRTGTLKPLMSAGTMPLPIDVQTLPIYLWELWRGSPFEPAHDLTEILPVGRATNLVFWGLLLVYTLRLGRAFGGAWAGRLASALVATDPNLVAHAALATTDIAITATTLVALLHFHSGLGRSWRRRVLIPGLCYGVAVLAKASAMAFVPLGFLVLGFHRIVTQPSEWRRSRRIRTFLLDMVQIVMVGTVVVFTYCGSDWTTERTFVEWAHKLPEGPLKNAMVPVSEQLRIFTNAGEALAAQIKHNFRGHGVYLHGDWHPRAIWYYFPFALSVKLPLATLALLAIAATRVRAWFGTPLGWLALVLVLFTLTCRVQIGIRLIFPTVAIVYVALAVAWFRNRPVVPRGRIALAAVVITINAAVTLACWPRGLQFTNLIYGGIDEGYRSLTDSNYDWGQGLPELATLARSDRPLAVWYYGTDPAAFRPPFHARQLHTLPVANADDVRRWVGKARLAVSTSILFGNPALSPSGKIAVDFLKQRRPVARTATFFIYDLDS